MSIFQAYDIRGLYPSEINEKIIYRIGKAFMDFIRCRKVVVARDMRISSPSLFNALTEALLEQGAEIIDIGLSSTPMFYYAVNELEADAGLMITASHNPGKYNGLKMVKSKAVPLNADTGIKEIEKMVEARDFKDAEEKGSLKTENVLEKYVSYVKSFANNIKELKVVIDCGNGMAGKTIIPLLESFNIKLIPMYEELDGTFPNHDANPFDEENMKDLQKRVVKEKADIGFAFDGDVDRVVMVDEKGERIPGDITTALIAKKMLNKNKGAKIMYDLRSTKSVKKVIEDSGGKPLVSRVGHSFIKTRMKKEDVLFAGEMSGHYYFKDNFFTDSAAIPVVIILSLLSSEKKKLSELIKSFKKYYHTGEINREVKDKDAVIARIENAYKNGKTTHLDGITVEFKDWWFNLRKSNTEPLIRLNLEADSKELMEEKKKKILKLIY